MSTEIARTQGTTISDKIVYARALADSALLPKHYQRNPANLLYALEYADALGVSPIHAITSIHVIEGKPTASADLIGSLVRKAGHKLRVSGDDSHAVAVIIRADDPGFEFKAEWTIEKAKAAGLTNKSVWKNYPGAMLRSRAITEVARMAAPDALYGVQYTAEELGANVNADGEPVSLGERPQSAQRPSAQDGSAVSRLAAAAAQQEQPEGGTQPPAAEVDWMAELDLAGDDVDAIKAVWRRAKTLNADQWVIDAINAAGSAAKDAAEANHETGELPILDAEEEATA